MSSGPSTMGLFSRRPPPFNSDELPPPPPPPPDDEQPDGNPLPPVDDLDAAEAGQGNKQRSRSRFSSKSQRGSKRVAQAPLEEEQYDEYGNSIAPEEEQYDEHGNTIDAPREETPAPGSVSKTPHSARSLIRPLLFVLGTLLALTIIGSGGIVYGAVLLPIPVNGTLHVEIPFNVWLPLLLILPGVILLVTLLIVWCAWFRKRHRDDPFDGVIDDPSEVWLQAALNEICALEHSEEELHEEIRELREKLEDAGLDPDESDDDEALLKRAVGHFIFRDAALAFNSWRHAVEEMTRKLTAATRAVRYALNRELAVGWSSWWSLWDARRRALEQMRSCVSRMIHRQLASGWHTWWKGWHDQREAMENARRPFAHLMNRGLSKGWQALAASTVAKRRKREAMARALTFALQRELTRGWRGVSASWREKQRKLKAASSALAFFLQRSLRRGWVALGGASALSPAALMDKAARYAMHRPLVNGFEAMREFWTVAKAAAAAKAVREAERLARGKSNKELLEEARALLKECAQLMIRRDGYMNENLDTLRERYLPSLLAACTHGQTDVARLLLDEGASADAAKASGWTCLMESVHTGRSSMAALLLERGALVNQSKVSVPRPAIASAYPDCALLTCVLLLLFATLRPTGGARCTLAPRTAQLPSRRCSSKAVHPSTSQRPTVGAR